MIARTLQFLLWFFVWLLLSWPIETKDIVFGVFVSLFVLSMTSDLLVGLGASAGAGKRGPIAYARMSLWFLCYMVVFAWECVKANIDVAYRVLHPTLPIRPGTVKVKVGLKSDIGLTFLANSITLTPGTTTVDVDKEGGYLYVHLLYVKEDRGRVKVVETFENILKRVFE